MDLGKLSHGHLAALAAPVDYQPDEGLRQVNLARSYRGGGASRIDPVQCQIRRCLSCH